MAPGQKIYTTRQFYWKIVWILMDHPCQHVGTKTEELGVAELSSP